MVDDMAAMLQAVMTRGTGRAAQINVPTGGKSGTTQDYRDAWFVGYSADFVAGVWMGNDDGSPTRRVSGGGLPARLWRQVMVKAHEGIDPRPLVAGRGCGFWSNLFGGLTRPRVETAPATEREKNPLRPND
jgi:penicillin-binding protein 1A